MALYADLNRKIRVLIKEGAENAEALFPAGYDFMKEEGDADLIVCASAPPEEANAPVVFWDAPRGRNDGFCLPKEENKGREKLRAYLSAAVMTNGDTTVAVTAGMLFESFYKALFGSKLCKLFK